MMRSMYSAVSGLKTHQTKMDVIGNNIANVNTVAFKSSSVTFQDILYQTTTGASGANAQTGVGGVNAKQIGLGVSMASTSVSIETAGASETTGNPFDIKLTDKNTTNFFIVNDGSQNLFTRAGSFYVDGVGNLCMTSTGYTVMGWQVDPITNEIRKDTVSALRIMQEKNLTSAPEATTNAVMGGVLDENDSDVQSDAGKIMNLNFYDSLGYQYTARFSIKATDEDGRYTVGLTSILDDDNNNIIEKLSAEQISKLFGANKEVTDKYGLTLNSTALEQALINNNTAWGGTLPATVQNLAFSFGTTGELLVTYDDATTTPATAVTETYTYDDATGTFTDGTNSFALEDVFGPSDLFTKMDATNAWLEGESYEIVFNGTDWTMNHTYLGMNTEVEKVYSKTDLIDPDNMVLLNDGNVEITTTTGVATYNFDGKSFVNIANSADVKRVDEIFNVTDSLKAVLGLGANPDPKLVSTDYALTYTDGAYTVTRKSPVYDLVFNTATGLFDSINGDPKAVTLNLGDAVDTVNVNGNFANINIDFTQCLNYNNSGKSTIGMDSGDVDGSTGKGRKLGNMIGVSIDTSGKIFGSYDNGNTELLGQIAVAQFSNAAGLEKVGESCYQTTLNSGEFDGIGVEVSADGSSMTTGELEMSNVDLSTEFTQMITTQRGFQANSRVITTSDSLLEELVNLKR